MDADEIQEFADANKLDVRQLHTWHFRLMDIYGEFVLDVYIRRTKAGYIKHNKVLVWQKNWWATVHTKKELKDLLK